MFNCTNLFMCSEQKELCLFFHGSCQWLPFCSDLVNMCLFMAVTEYSILRRYWVGYDLQFLSSSSNTAFSHHWLVSNPPNADTARHPVWFHHEKLIWKITLSYVNKGAKARGPRLLWRYFPLFPVKCIQSLKPHWSPPSFSNSQMWDRQRGLTAGQG